LIRKKKKHGEKKKLVEVSKIVEEEKPQKIEVKRTKAELAFQKMQEKMVRYNEITINKKIRFKISRFYSIYSIYSITISIYNIC
jgi:hypothetical protein